MTKALIGKYYKTAEAAIEAYENMSFSKRRHQSVVQIGSAFMIVGNEAIRIFNMKGGENK